MSVVSGVMGREEEDPEFKRILDKVQHLLDDHELAILCWRSSAIYSRGDRESAFTGHPNFHAYSYFKGD